MPHFNNSFFLSRQKHATNVCTQQTRLYQLCNLRGMQVLGEISNKLEEVVYKYKSWKFFASIKAQAVVVITLEILLA